MIILFFNNEYKDLSLLWSQFGDNFQIDFGQVFDENFADSVDKKLRKHGDSKAVNELSFRVLRKTSSDKPPIDSWDLKWVFNPFGFESSKHLDLKKVTSLNGYFYKHSLSLDPLFIKRSESTPTINNIHMFLAVSTNMKKGAVVKKTDKESDKFTGLLSKLKEHNYITESELKELDLLFKRFKSLWQLSVVEILEKPLCGSLTELEGALESLVKQISVLTINKEKSNELLYELISAHTVTVNENSNYCIYLPWSPFSLLMQSKRNFMLRNIASKFREKSLDIGNKSDGVLAKLFRELLESNGKSFYLKKIGDSSFVDLVCTKSNAGYFEYGRLSTSKNAISDAEIKSVVNATATKFLETYPNERHHLQILCVGLFSYDHLLAVYDELLKITDNHEEQLSIALAFNCNNRHALDVIYQTICEGFDAARVDSNITIKIVSNMNEIEDGEIDLIYNFDPLFAHNKIASIAPQYIEREFSELNWEYCSSRKVPSDPVAKKTQFSMNNHVLDRTAKLFHTAFMRTNNLKEDSSFCREVSQTGLVGEISKGLSKCNWLIIYDFLLSKETLSICNDNRSPNEVSSNRRVLRYVQGEGSKRSLAIITDKETHFITKNLNQNLKNYV